MINFRLPGGGLFSSPKPPPLPPPPPPLPTPEDPEIKKRAKEVSQARKRAAGLTSTIKTGGLGDVSEATVTRKTLGG